MSQGWGHLGMPGRAGNSQTSRGRWRPRASGARGRGGGPGLTWDIKEKHRDLQKWVEPWHPRAPVPTGMQLAPWRAKSLTGVPGVCKQISNMSLSSKSC